MAGGHVRGDESMGLCDMAGANDMADSDDMAGKRECGCLLDWAVL